MRKFEFIFLDNANNKIERTLEPISEIDAKDLANRILSDMQVTYKTWFFVREIKMRTKEEVQEKVKSIEDSIALLKTAWDKEKNVGFYADTKLMDYLDNRCKENQSELRILQWVLGE